MSDDTRSVPPRTLGKTGPVVAAVALDSYADQPDDLTRLVPNPAKHRATDRVKAARQDLIEAHAGVADTLDSAVVKAGHPGTAGKALVDPQPARR